MPTVRDDAKKVATPAGNDIGAEAVQRRSEEIRVQRILDDVRYWRERAEAIRTEAEFSEKSIVRATLLDTAYGYEVMASRIEERLGQRVKPRRP